MSEQTRPTAGLLPQQWRDKAAEYQQSAHPFVTTLARVFDGHADELDAANADLRAQLQAVIDEMNTNAAQSEKWARKTTSVLDSVGWRVIAKNLRRYADTLTTIAASLGVRRVT